MVPFFCLSFLDPVFLFSCVVLYGLLSPNESVKVKGVVVISILFDEADLIADLFAYVNKLQSFS